MSDVAEIMEEKNDRYENLIENIEHEGLSSCYSGKYQQVLQTKLIQNVTAATVSALRNLFVATPYIYGENLR